MSVVRLSMASRRKSRYAIGYQFEREIREKLSKAGFYMFRCAGSKPVDFIAVKDGYVFLIEAKKGVSSNNIPVELIAISEGSKLPAIYIVRRKGKTFWRIVGDLREDITERIKMVFGEPL